MLDGYRLDLAGMGALIDQLDQAERTMTDATDALKDLAPRDLGSGELDDAGADFQDRWEYGIGRIAEATGKMVEALRDTRKQYEEIERATAELFPAGPDGPAPGGPVPAGPAPAPAGPPLALEPAGQSEITRRLG